MAATVCIYVTFLSLRSLISKMGTLIPALLASLDRCGKVKEKMSMEAPVWCQVLCPLAVPCLHCARDQDDGNNDDDDDEHHRNTDSCTHHFGKLYIHFLNECTKHTDEWGLR